jgi:hypothetical protein
LCLPNANDAEGNQAERAGFSGRDEVQAAVLSRL